MQWELVHLPVRLTTPEPRMQKPSNAKTTTPTQRTAAQQTPLRKRPSAPQPLDLKTLERVAGGSTDLPNKYW